MTADAFTKKFTDHSSAQGYQFEFHCDECGAGFRSRPVSSSMSLEAGLLGAAESLLAGAGFKDTLLDRNRNHAFAAAVTEMKPKFHQRADGKWVCSACRNAPAPACPKCAAPSTGSKFCPDCGTPRAG